MIQSSAPLLAKQPRWRESFNKARTSTRLHVSFDIDLIEARSTFTILFISLTILWVTYTFINLMN